MGWRKPPLSPRGHPKEMEGRYTWGGGFASRAASRRALRAGLDGLLAGKAQAVLAPEHEQAGGRDDGGADHHRLLRRLAEGEPADQEGPDHRRVLERRHEGGVSVAVALGQENLPDAAENAD